MGKCCICGWDDIKEISNIKLINLDEEKKFFKLSSGKTFKEGDFLTLNGTTGDVYEGLLELVPPNLDDNVSYKILMQWADSFRKLGIRTNAE